jgi:hypothetical protein
MSEVRPQRHVEVGDDVAQGPDISFVQTLKQSQALGGDFDLVHACAVPGLVQSFLGQHVVT